MIANEITLKKFFTYNNSVYQIYEKFNKLERKNIKKTGKGLNTKTKASTGAKMMFMSSLCYHNSINELKDTMNNEQISLINLFDKREFVPKTHGLRDCIIDTDYKQISDINDSIVSKLKENKIFKKNTVDGLMVCAWDGVELCETKKNISNLPEREHENGEVNKYLKYLCAMNVGERANIIIATKQMTEKEKVATKIGLLKAKTFGETTAFTSLLPEVEQKIGKTIDVHVMDALFLTSKIMRKIDERNQYFVIRIKNENYTIYKDSKEIFKKTVPKIQYEIVEIIQEIEVKYSKSAKHKSYSKTKVDIKERNITNTPLGPKTFISKNVSNQKNSIRITKIYERVIKKIDAWEGEFDFSDYRKPVRVVRSKEKEWNNGKITEQELYIATNMYSHNLRTIIKIMHLRWHIENNGFRKLKQQYKVDRIYIGEFNALNYVFQMKILIFNLLELYIKFRIKLGIKHTFIILKKLFENEIITNKDICSYFSGNVP